MFAAIYFGQEFFAGLPFIPVVPPPPPPPPPPVITRLELCHEFAIGICIGTETNVRRTPRTGVPSCVPTAGRAIGVSSGPTRRQNPC